MKRLLAFAALLAASLLHAARGEDWPMWRANASRSASINNTLPAEFHLQWTAKLGARTQVWDDPLNLDLMTYDRVFEPIVYQGMVCVGFNDQDKLIALDAETGEKKWTYYTEAPVRLPPVGHGGKIYFCSDDGFLYCVSAEDGSLHWKFRGAPNAQKAIGNHRLTSAWPARGGPVVYDDKVYFAASIWPFMGTFIYALDAETGEVDWLNDSTGAQYIKQPHSAPSFAGVAPQGAMVATKDYLIVPGGRSVPAVFDRKTGELKHFEINAGGKGTGGSFVTADELHYYVHTRHKGTRAFNIASGKKTAFTPNEPVLSDGKLYSAEQIEKKHVVRAYDASDDKNVAREPIWQIKAKGQNDLILVGETLLAAGKNRISAIQVPTTANGKEKPQRVNTIRIKGLQKGEAIARLLVAAQRLFVVGDKGTISAFGSKPEHPTKIYKANVARQSHTIPDIAQQLCSVGDLEGYAFWFGACDSPKLRALVQHSTFSQLAVVDDNAERVSEFRKFLDGRGLLGRVSVHVSSPEDFLAPKYVAHMVFATKEIMSSKESVAAAYRPVRPYGGTMVVVNDDNENFGDDDLAFISDCELEKAESSFSTLASSDQVIVVKRVGALPGAADWTHQYGDIANTVKSNDSRVKLPLGILWFGGSSNMDVLPRHGHGPPEQVIGGRLFIEGMNTLSARDVYTGRVLWKRDFEDLGTFDVYYDTTFDDTPLDTKYNQVHIPGANGRGTNYVVTEDRIYLVVGASCIILDPATGKDLGTIEMPKNDDGTQPEWGFLGVYEDVLLGGVGFANYRERHDLKFESEKDIKKNKAGFGSKSFDRAASRGLIAFDRHTGAQLWRLDASHSFWHNGIVAGGGRIYCLDKNPTKIEEAMRRRGLALPDTYRIACLDARTGISIWEVKEHIFGTWLGYSAAHDLLLQAGAQASDRLSTEVGQGMRVYSADSGKVHWKKDDLKYAGPCILHNDLIITNANSYSESAGAFYLSDGRKKTVTHPLTGKTIPWTMTRAYGCNNIIASENMLTFRSGAAGYYDLTTDSGTGNIGGFKSGCTSNLVIANGVLNAPDYTRTCSCAYQNQTSLALVHMPDIEVWSVNALAAMEPKNSKGKTDDSVLVDAVGLNFGAAGDRKDTDGNLWLEYPAKAGASPPFKVEFNSDAEVFAQHSASRVGDPIAWISSSGVENLTNLKIDFQLTKELDLAQGIPVSHVDDDAEESEDGEVSISSSDLELTEDGGSQIVGLRFASVPLTKQSKIHEAYLQFTCDEPTDKPATLTVSGQLSSKPARFSEDSHDVSSRTRTNADVVWSPPEWKKSGDSAKAQRTGDISKILRELIGQPDWKTGNAMAFVIDGVGQRVAVASNGKNKESPKLVVVADTPIEDLEQPGPTQNYDIELVFALPRAASKTRQFDIFIGDKKVAGDVTIKPSQDSGVHGSTKVKLQGIPVGRQLEMRFDGKQGKPLLCGLHMKQST